VAAACLAALSVRVKLLERELTDRIQHAVTRRCLVQRLDEHDAGRDQGADCLERIKAVRITFEEGFDRFERESADEYPEPPEQALLGRSQQVIAPGDRRPQGLLPGGQVPRAAGQQRQPALEPCQQGRGRKHGQASACELDCQRQAVQAAADLGHGGGVGFGQLEAGPCIAPEADEQSDRRHGGEGAQIKRDASLGQRQRRDGHDSLAADAQRLAAGRQHFQPGRELQDLLGERCRRQQLLDVIDDHEHLARSEEGEQALIKRLRWRGRNAKLPGHGIPDQRRIGQRFERDERGAPPAECERRPVRFITLAAVNPIPARLPTALRHHGQWPGYGDADGCNKHSTWPRRRDRPAFLRVIAALAPTTTSDGGLGTIVARGSCEPGSGWRAGAGHEPPLAVLWRGATKPGVRPSPSVPGGTSTVCAGRTPAKLRRPRR